MTRWLVLFCFLSIASRASAEGLQRPPAIETPTITIEATITVATPAPTPAPAPDPAPAPAPTPDPAPAPAPAPPPAPAPAAPSITPFLTLRGELLLTGADYAFGAGGGSSALGLRFDQGWSAALVLGYLGDLDGRFSELDVALEGTRDFSPTDPMGFLLVARIGTGIGLGDATKDTFVRPFAQLGVGGRFDLGGGIALTVDLRGVLRLRPDDPFGGTQLTPIPGLALTMGLVVPL